MTLVSFIVSLHLAAPTMHQLILQTGRTNGFISCKRKKLKLRMIANAAGGLLPSLAEEMMEAFDANVCFFFYESLLSVVVMCAKLSHFLVLLPHR